MIMSSTKHQVVALVYKNVHLGEEVVVTPQEQEQELVGSETSVLIIDAMCVVNMVIKTPDLTQGAHFAEKFLDIIAAMNTGYESELHLISTYLVLLKNEPVPKGYQRQHYYISSSLSCK